MRGLRRGIRPADSTDRAGPSGEFRLSPARRRRRHRRRGGGGRRDDSPARRRHGAGLRPVVRDRRGAAIDGRGRTTVVSSRGAGRHPEFPDVGIAPDRRAITRAATIEETRRRPRRGERRVPALPRGRVRLGRLQLRHPPLLRPAPLPSRIPSGPAAGGEGGLLGLVPSPADGGIRHRAGVHRGGGKSGRRGHPGGSGVLRLRRSRSGDGRAAGRGLRGRRVDGA
mmetsp:Transcript_36130/g.77046  ORF Transcript_36130/g.77046 Transcript_36130/m.77046 type:complete len:225 (+) Transcript_36130:272-946(+)